MKTIYFSLVLYNQDINYINPLITSILDFNKYIDKTYFRTVLLVHDNSTQMLISEEYFNLIEFASYYKSENIGFGAGHNHNIFSCPNIDINNDIIIVINPDIEFNPASLLDFLSTFISRGNSVCIAPLIKDLSGNIQYSAKHNPTLFSLLVGRFHFLQRFSIFKQYIIKHQNRDKNYSSEEISSQYLSGCFLLIKASCFFAVRGFDMRFFLHLEDADFVRRCSFIGDTYHSPQISVVHRWARGSHKSIKQMFFLVVSLLKYFIKWGIVLY